MKIQVGKPVTGNDLIGRENEIQEIESCIEMGQSVVLIAPRRYGKTSILLEMLRRQKIKKNLFTSYIDIFSIPDMYHLSAEILREMLSNRKLYLSVHRLKYNIAELMKNIQFRHEIEGHEFIFQFGQTGIDEWNLLKSSLQFIEAFAKKHNKQAIAIFDEFGDIGKLDGDSIVKLFRSELQLQKNTVFLFSGSFESVMSEIFVSSSSPFYRFARIIHIKEVESPKFNDYLISIFTKSGITDAEDLAYRITNFTKGHPYYTQLLAQLVIIHRENLSKKEGAFNQLIQIALDREVNFLEKMWEVISAKSQERSVILEIVKGNNNLYTVMNTKKINVSRTIQRLLSTGMLKKKGKLFTLTDPLLSYWINTKILKIPINQKQVRY